jgi:hypothetical protein
MLWLYVVYIHTGLLDWSRPYALGRMWGFALKLATSREFMIAHSFLMISANVVASLIGLEVIPINTKWFLFMLDIVNLPLVLSQANKLSSLPGPVVCHHHPITHHLSSY